MMMVPVRAGVALVLVLAAAGSAAAQQAASPWQKDRQSSLRLLAGARDDAAAVGGVELRLDPGWHTYWRDPGDSGVPPRFDFSKSDNVESVSVLFPAPKAFDDGAGGQSLGYTDHVVLPLRIVAKNPSKPLTLRATVNYAVCDKICVPVEASAELSITTGSSTDGTLQAAFDALPKLAEVGDANPLTIRAVRRDGKHVMVDVAAPETAEVSLLAEGPTAEWALPVPRQISASAGVRHFGFALEGLPPGASADGATLKLTLIGPDQAREFDVRLP
ncbi:protein-disulfide reductase DsbD family protein [soil metagenome]